MYLYVQPPAPCNLLGADEVLVEGREGPLGGPQLEGVEHHLARPVRKLPQLDHLVHVAQGDTLLEFRAGVHHEPTAQAAAVQSLPVAPGRKEKSSQRPFPRPSIRIGPIHPASSQA
jgi:hypothetical protein